jgi:mono/diheme cytochrome c family protein
MGIRHLIAIMLSATALAACIDDTGFNGTASPASQAMIEDGRAMAEANCASCHAIGRTGSSPQPKAPAFRTILKRYNAEMLATELSEGMRVAHGPMPQFQFRPEAVDSLIAYLRSIEVTNEGQALVEQHCAKCHAIGKTDTSPYPGAQPFRNLGQRWRRDQLGQALQAGIIAEHDRADVRVPPMKISAAEAEALLDYLDTIATPSNPAPR